jgi:hypothetical protein
MQTLITKYSADLTFDPQQSDRLFLNLVEYYLRDVENGRMSVEEAIDCATADWERDQESWD